ncbi:hypothetical protein Q7C36_013012 [Tachysurus vachellii]|uniref:Uncharacterized protein n=1 Tax=Tachysurus vachellii TaxID=175792 RepID=A0AA88MNP4_TACVA|nr:hypothetical protein Q7C36_013012 [Tachysurus vachellii]
MNTGFLVMVEIGQPGLLGAVGHAVRQEKRCIISVKYPIGKEKKNGDPPPLPPPLPPALPLCRTKTNIFPTEREEEGGPPLKEETRLGTMGVLCLGNPNPQ